MSENVEDKRRLVMPKPQRILEFLNMDLAARIKEGEPAEFFLPSYRQMARDVRDEAKMYVQEVLEE